MSRTAFCIFRAALLGCAGFSGTLAAESLVGLRASDLHLISFDSATPGTLTGDLTLTGFPTGVSPVSLDFRPATQTLSVIARGPPGNSCQQYSINTVSGVASVQGIAFACPADFSDIDFNPVSDQMRVLSTSENFKVSADGVKDADTDPAFAVNDVNTGDSPLIGGSAYDQITESSTATTLFAIETGNDILVRVGSVNGSPDPPDTGELTTVGALNLNVEADTVFDISGISPGTAYLFSFTPAQAGFEGNLYTVDLTSGATSLVGRVGAGGVSLVGLTTAPAVTLGDPDDDRVVWFGGASPLLLLLLLVAGRLRICQRQRAR